MARSRGAHDASFDSADTPCTTASARSFPQRSQPSPTFASRARSAARTSLPHQRRSGPSLPRPSSPPRDSQQSPSELYPPPPKELRPDYLRGRNGGRTRPERSHRSLKSNGPDEGNDYEAVIRSDYRLGDVARSPSHMILKSSPEMAMAAVDAMTNLDFAFVRQSDGSWTYAVLALRSWGDGGPGPSSEESLLFVVDRTGRTTNIARSEWGWRVRPPAAESATASVAAARRDDASQLVSNDGSNGGDECTLSPGEVKLERWWREYHDLLRSVRPPDVVSFGAEEEDAVSCLSAPRELSGRREEQSPDSVLYFC